MRYTGLFMFWYKDSWVRRHFFPPINFFLCCSLAVGGASRGRVCFGVRRGALFPPLQLQDAGDGDAQHPCGGVAG